MVQEVELLRARFGGQVVWLRPTWRARARYPSSLLGLHRLLAIRRPASRSISTTSMPQLKLDKHHDLVESSPSSTPSPRAWTPRRRLPPLSFLQRLAAIVVPSGTNRAALGATDRARPARGAQGIDVTRFVDSPTPAGPNSSSFRLHPLDHGAVPDQGGRSPHLEVTREIPDIRLIFLWRGLHMLPELVAHIQKLGLSGRVEGSSRVGRTSTRVMDQVRGAAVLTGRRGAGQSVSSLRSSRRSPPAGRWWSARAGIRWPPTWEDTGCRRVLARLRQGRARRGHRGPATGAMRRTVRAPRRSPRGTSRAGRVRRRPPAALSDARRLRPAGGGENEDPMRSPPPALATSWWTDEDLAQVLPSPPRPESRTRSSPGRTSARSSASGVTGRTMVVPWWRGLQAKSLRTPALWSWCRPPPSTWSSPKGPQRSRCTAREIPETAAELAVEEFIHRHVDELAEPRELHDLLVDRVGLASREAEQRRVQVHVLLRGSGSGWKPTPSSIIGATRPRTTASPSVG